jgi:hypothetical protein
MEEMAASVYKHLCLVLKFVHIKNFHVVSISSVLYSHS